MHRRTHLPPLALDVALALILFAAGQAEAWGAPLGSSIGHGSDLVAALLAAVATLPLALRRVAPIAVALLVTVPIPVVLLFTPVRLLFFGGFVSLVLVAYTLASRAHDRRSAAAVALPFVALLALELEVGGFRQVGEVVFDWFVFAAALAIGRIVHARSARADRSESLVETLELEREAVLVDERARIARELHDVIAHSVSVIVIQAGAAGPLVDEDPEQAREALASIRSSASEALGEMRRLLGVLRVGDDGPLLSPQPSVARIEPLLAQSRAAGLDVTLRVEGDPRPLAAGVDLAAYRIVQEALTNTRKHGAATRVDVALRYRFATFELEVLDDGSAAPIGAGAGHGLVGMRERVALYEGKLEVGPADGGGFAVRAVLPT